MSRSYEESGQSMAHFKGTQEAELEHSVNPHILCIQS